MPSVEEQIQIDLGRLAQMRVAEAIKSVLQIAETDAQRLAILTYAVTTADAVASGAVDAMEGKPALTTKLGEFSAAVFARMAVVREAQMEKQ